MLEGLPLAKPFGQLDVLAAGHAISARVHQARGDVVAATADLAQVEAMLATGVFDRWWLPRARVWLEQGNLAAAERWATRHGITAETPVRYQHEGEQVVLARVLLKRGAFSDALRLLDRLMTASEAGGRLGTLIEVLALKALAHQGVSEREQALASLQRALLLAEGEGYVCTFADEGPQMAALLRDAVQRDIAPAYCVSLLTAFGADAHAI